MPTGFFRETNLMSDAEARVLAAGETVSVDGRDVIVRPITMQSLHEVQREAVKYFKREYIQTFADNADLMPDGTGAELIRQKLEEAARWDVGDLPTRTAFDVRGVVLSDLLLREMGKLVGELPDQEPSKRAVLATLLDQGRIAPDKIKEWTGSPVRSARVPYDSWWVTAVYSGMVTFVWAAVRADDPSITREQIGRWPLAKIMEAARLVERLTAPALGNT